MYLVTDRVAFQTDKGLGDLGKTAVLNERELRWVWGIRTWGNPLMREYWDECQGLGHEGHRTSPVSLALLFLLHLPGVVLVGFCLLVLLQVSHVALLILLCFVEIALPTQRVSERGCVCVCKCICVCKMEGRLYRAIVECIKTWRIVWPLFTACLVYTTDLMILSRKYNLTPLAPRG